MSVLNDITNVESLGLNLGICMSASERITINYPLMERQKTKVIYYWLQRRDIVRHKQNEHPTLGALADAMRTLNPSLSDRIRLEHCWT